MKGHRTVAKKKEQFIEEMSKSLGIKTLAARRTKIGRTMLYEYINTDKEFALKIQEIEEAAVDFAESKLHELMMLGDRASVMFFLKAKGKGRGYY
jgi:hypothetical protein